MSVIFFFFQAEDGIRDLTVTGVQTCALPISVEHRAKARLQGWQRGRVGIGRAVCGWAGRRVGRRLGGAGEGGGHGFANSKARQPGLPARQGRDRKSTRLNSSHSQISYAVFCLKKKKKEEQSPIVVRHEEFPHKTCSHIRQLFYTVKQRSKAIISA